MNTFRTLAMWLVFAQFLTCTANNYFFRTVDVKDGLSDNFVRDISSDSYGYVWFSTINGLSRYDGYRMHSYMPRQFGGHSNDVKAVRETADSTLWMLSMGELYTYTRSKDIWKKDGAERLSKLGVEGSMKVFYVDDKHNLWVTTENGLYHYDYSRKKLKFIANFSKSPILHVVSKNDFAAVVTTDYKIYEVTLQEGRLIPVGQAPIVDYNRDSHVFIDNYMNLWIYNSHSLAGTQWLLSIKTRQWRQLPELKQMGNALVNTIAETNDGNLWIGTGNEGIHVFSYTNYGAGLERVTRMKAFKPYSSHISCFYLDNNNTMWVGSAKLGVAFTDMSSPNFNIVSTGDYEDVSSLVQDRSGNLWIGFDGGGVMMKSANGTESHFSALRQQLPSDIVTSLVINKDGSVLVGTYGDGIARLEGNKFTPIYSQYAHLKYVKAMTYDSNGDLWVATVDKGVVRVRPDGNMTHFTSDNSSLLFNGVLCLACDSLHNVMYIGTSLGISTYDYAKEQFVKNSSLEKLKGSFVSALMLCNRNILWIGTRNGLWTFCSKDNTVRHFTTDQGMSHNNIRALVSSGDKVWASTDNGLTSISLKNENNAFSYKCYPYFDSDGLDNVVFSNNAALTTNDGTALLGCFTGYVSIQPGSECMNLPKMKLRFTDFLLNGEMKHIPPSGFTVKYNDRLRIYVSAMMPALNQKIKYLYRFKGDEEWMRAPGNMLYFVSLHPGNQVLQVKAEVAGVTKSEIAELPFNVLPSFWFSKTAFLLYLLLLAALIYFFYRAAQRRQKREFAIRQLELNLEKYEMEEEKIRFFTNISHDLKTPLTLVVAPLEKIRNINLPAPIRTEVDVAWRNARQLHELILQLLDFRRLDVGKEKLHLKHGDIVGFVRQTAQGFSYYGTRKNVNMQLNLPTDAVEINFDENKMRRIITNLLSNAYKYNVDNGSVTVSLDIKPDGEKQKMMLSVADTGIGVNDKRRVFDRFMQETHGQEQEGSGLGLHIVKQYVEMMGGTITLDDNKPKGSIFTVTLPVADAVEVETETQPDKEVADVADGIASDEGVQDKPVVMVVEDNGDAREFLQRSLDDEYKVLVAANGKEALQLLSEVDNVSIVVSDVMMPEMDGIELFRHMKGNINYSHIPVVFLTAKSSDENIVEGLKEGAADYITKPFSLAVLRLRIQKILEWTQNAHSRVSQGFDINPSEITVSSLDEELISNVMANIEANIQDVNYSVVQLSSAVGMTRGHLYKKLMAITGKSPLEFIRIVKMKRGKSLLEQGKTNISEVANMVGFSAKQFSHYFKLTYDETPSEYLKRIKQQP